MRKRNYNQVIRIDAMKKFVEVLDSSYGIGKIKWFAAELDQNNKQSASIDYYQDITDFLAMRAEVDNSSLAEISKDMSAKGNLYNSIWQIEGGKKVGDEIIAKRMKLLPSKKENHIMLQFEIGKGAEGRTGGFVFKGRAEKFIGIPIEISMLRKYLAYIEISYRAYESAYMKEKGNAPTVKNGEIIKTLKESETKKLLISDSSYNIDRMKMSFIEVNNDLTEKERIDYFVDLPDYLNLSQILNSPELPAFLKKKAVEAKEILLFEIFGGKAANKKPRLDGKAAAWTMKLFTADNQQVKIVVQVGTGSEGRNGGIVFDTAEREVSLTFPLSKLRAFILNGQMSIQAYYNAYAAEKYGEEVKKRVQNEKDKFWKKEEGAEKAS